MSIGDNKWVMTALGNADYFFGLAFGSEKKLRTLSFVAHIVDRLDATFALIAPELNTNLISTLSFEKDWIQKAIWNRQLMDDLIGLTLPVFMLELVKHQSESLFSAELETNMYEYYTQIIHKLIHRTFVDTSSEEAIFYEWAVTFWTLFMVKEGGSIAKKMADEFYSNLRLKDERTLIMSMDAHTSMEKLMSQWRMALAEKIWTSLTINGGWTCYNGVQPWLNNETMMRQSSGESYLLKFKYTATNAVEVEISDNSVWWMQVTSRACAFLYNRYSIDSKWDVVPLLKSEQIDAELLRFYTLSIEQKITTVKPANSVMPYAKRRSWIPVDHLMSYLLNGTVSFPKHTTDFMINIINPEVPSDMFSVNKISIPTGADIKEAYIERQIHEMTGGATIRLFGNQIETKTTLATELATIYALRAFSCWFPKTTTLGAVEVVNTNIFGTPHTVNDYFKDNEAVCLNITLVSRFLRALNITDVISVTKPAFLGHDILMKIIKALLKIGLEDVKKELFGTWYPSLNEAGNAIRNVSLHAEWSSSVANTHFRDAFTRMQTNTAKALLLKGFISTISSSEWKDAVLQALSIAICHKTDTEDVGGIVGDIYLDVI